MMKIGQKELNASAIVFLSPAVIAVMFIVVYPVAYGLLMGFTDRSLSYDNFSFIGFDNFMAIFRDPVFFRALGNTFKLTLLAVLLYSLMGFCMALLLNSSERYIGFFRVLFFLPWVLPSTVVAFSFRWLYNDYYGYINYLLLKYNIIEAAVNPLARMGLVWPAILLPTVWFTYPFVMLAIGSALKSIDRNMLEAARIDGANRWQIFRELTLPALTPTIIMLTVLQVIWEFSSFDLVYLLTKGGPGNATLTLSLYIYRRAFAYRHIGYSCALATVLFVIIVFLIMVYFILAKRGEKDES